MNIFRREFLLFLGAATRLRVARARQVNTGELAAGCTFFNRQQARTLEEICDVLIPPDEFAGGKQAGVLFFIDRALSNWAPQHRWDYRVGLEAMDESSRLLYKAPFTELSMSQRTAVLEAVEAGSAPGTVWQSFSISRRDGSERPLEITSARGKHSGPAFFDLMIGHVMQGYYGSPQYGGNRNGVSWDMIGYSGMQHS